MPGTDERLFVMLLLTAATAAFAFGFLTELSNNGFDPVRLGLALLAAAFLFERVAGRPA